MGGPKCGDCGRAIIGVPRLRPVEYRRLKKRERRVNRAYGGSRCASCVRTRVVRAFLIEEQKCVKQVMAEKNAQAREKEPARKRVIARSGEADSYNGTDHQEDV